MSLVTAITSSASFTYTAITTESFTVEWAIGEDTTVWDKYLDEVVTNGTSNNATDAEKEAAEIFSSFMLSIKLTSPSADGDGIVMLNETDEF